MKPLKMALILWLPLGCISSIEKENLRSVGSGSSHPQVEVLAQKAIAIFAEAQRKLQKITKPTPEEKALLLVLQENQNQKQNFIDYLKDENLFLQAQHTLSCLSLDESGDGLYLATEPGLHPNPEESLEKAQENTQEEPSQDGRTLLFFASGVTAVSAALGTWGIWASHKQATANVEFQRNVIQVLKDSHSGELISTNHNRLDSINQLTPKFDDVVKYGGYAYKAGFLGFLCGLIGVGIATTQNRESYSLTSSDSNSQKIWKDLMESLSEIERELAQTYHLKSRDVMAQCPPPL